jgi:hypothetical protein
MDEGVRHEVEHESGGAVALAVTAWTSEAVGMRTCGPRSTLVVRSAFAGFRFPPEVDHVTIYRWVLRFTPLLSEAARPCRHAVGDRWFVDET